MMSEEQKKPEDTTDRQIPLIEEYKLCDKRTARLEGYIWQTAALFGVGSVVGLVAAANEISTSQNSVVISTAIAAIFGIVVSLVWWRFARRWWSIQHLMFERMREIDREVGSKMSVIVHNRDHEAYADRRHRQINGSLISKLYNRLFEIPPHTKPKLSDNVHKYEYRGMRESARLLVCTTILLWVSLFFYAVHLSNFQLELSIIFTLFIIMTLILWRRM